MRGHQPPECLTRIGARFNLNPHFFLRHLEYLWSSRPLKLFSSPQLPSVSYRILRLKLVTLGEREEKRDWSSSSQIRSLRTKSENSMKDYLHDVTREYMLNPGNSIVRTFNMHSTRYFSIEQEVTVTVQATDSGCLGMSKFANIDFPGFADPAAVLVWTDAGQHLGNGPEGPWRSERPRSNPRKSVFIPTIQHFADEEMKRLSRLRSSGVYPSEGPFTQSALSLAQNYGLTLDQALASADSFYAITELCQTSANSICQLLNLVETIIDTSTGYNQYKSQDYSLGNMSYHQDILKRLVLRLRENILDLESYQSSQWPRSYGPSDEKAIQSKAKAVTAAESLLTDFRNLLSRAEHISLQCQGGMSVCMNSAAIAESQRAIEQAKQIERLTRLAFFYIPLSFATSFFGMNLRIFGSGHLNLWIWFAAAIPLLLLSYLILAWFSGDLGRRLLFRKSNS